jgi:pimeloyl-ACP methyl ester carboxylesterase
MLPMNSKHYFAIILTGSFLMHCDPLPKNTQEKMDTNHYTQTIQKQNNYAHVNGLKMYYEIHGEGFPLVLIHGGGSSINTTFGKVIDDLAKKHRVIAVEIQAHGHTADIDRPLSFSRDADDIAALLKDLKIEKANVFGFSNGASTTLQMALRHPSLVNKIVVASTFYNKKGAPPWFWEMMSKPSFETMPQPYKDAFLAINPDSTALYRMYERDVARMQSFPEMTEEEMRRINAPAFIIIGDKDVVLPEHALEMHRLLPASRLAILPGGHGDYIGELTTPADTLVITGTLAMINQFLATDFSRSK